MQAKANHANAQNQLLILKYELADRIGEAARCGESSALRRLSHTQATGVSVSDVRSVGTSVSPFSLGETHSLCERHPKGASTFGSI